MGVFIDRHFKFSVFAEAGTGGIYFNKNGQAYYLNEALANFEYYTHTRVNGLPGICTSDGKHWYTEASMPADVRYQRYHSDKINMPVEAHRQGLDTFGPAGLLVRCVVTTNNVSGYTMKWVNDKNSLCGSMPSASNRLGQFYFPNAFTGLEAGIHVITPTPLGWIATPGGNVPAPDDVPFSTVLTNHFLTETK